MVCKHPTLPGQGARTQPGIQVTLWKMPPGPAPSQVTAPTCLCHTGIYPVPVQAQAGACTVRAQLPRPALLPSDDVLTAALALGKGEVVLKAEGQSHQQ